MNPSTLAGAVVVPKLIAIITPTCLPALEHMPCPDIVTLPPCISVHAFPAHRKLPEHRLDLPSGRDYMQAYIHTGIHANIHRLDPPSGGGAWVGGD